MKTLIIALLILTSALTSKAQIHYDDIVKKTYIDIKPVTKDSLVFGNRIYVSSVAVIDSIHWSIRSGGLELWSGDVKITDGFNSLAEAVFNCEGLLIEIKEEE